MSARIRTTLPWLICFAIVAGLLATQDLEEVARSIQRADAAAFLGTVGGFCLLLYLLDGAIWTALVRRLLGPIRFFDVLRVKAVSYFLDVIHYGAAAAGAAHMIHRIGGFGFLSTLSALLWLTVVDAFTLIVLMTVGWTVSGESMPGVMADVMPVILLAGWGVIIGTGLYWHAGWDFFVLGRVRSWRIFEAFRNASLRDVAAIGGMRLAFLITYAVYDWAVLPAFDIHVGYDQMLVYSPIIAFAQAVPGTVSGLGAIQPMLMALYADHVGGDVADPMAQVFAFTAVFGLVMTAARLVIGFIFLGGIVRDVIPSREEIEAARAREVDDDASVDG